MSPAADVQLDGGRYQGPRPPVSIVILTYNEEGNIADCIRSCAWCDDVHVLDSGSSDRTAEIARSMGVTVHTNRFRSFGDQRNWAIDHIPCRHPWHFHLDADERFTPEVVREMVDLLGPDGSASDKACYLCPSKMIFMGEWIKHSAGYPSYQVRLFRFGQCRFVDFGHGQREDSRGPVGTMVQPYMHYSFSKGLNEWLNKHNEYSEREAAEGIAIQAEHPPSLRAMFTGDMIARRRAFKNLSYFLKVRAFWRFLYNYFFRGGVLDGIPGFHYCAMISMYEYWIELKIKERRQRWGAITNELVVRMTAESEARTVRTLADTPHAPLSEAVPPGPRRGAATKGEVAA
ncbi:MAG: glycosyltransferase family 2 protein [Phycisphaerales bacterium]